MKRLLQLLCVVMTISVSAQNSCKPDWDKTDVITGVRTVGYQCSPPGRTIFNVVYKSDGGYFIYLRQYIPESTGDGVDSLILKQESGKISRFAASEVTENAGDITFSSEKYFSVGANFLKELSEDGIVFYRVQRGKQGKTYELDKNSAKRIKSKIACLLQQTE